MSETTRGSRCRWLKAFLARAILAAAGTWCATTNALAADEPWWAGIITYSQEEHYTASPGYEWRQDEDAGHHGPHYLPPVIGGFTKGPRGSTLRFPVDRVVITNIPVNGGEAPNLPAANVTGGSALTLQPQQPFNVFRGNSSLTNSPSPVTAQQLQQIYRLCTSHTAFQAAGPPIAIPPNVVSTLTVDQINAAFAATGQPYDLVSIVGPSAAISNAANQVLNDGSGRTVFDPTTSAALRSKNTETNGTLNGNVNNGDLFDVLYAFDYVVDMAVPSPSADGLIGRSRVAVNGAVRTTDRLFFDYVLVNDGLPASRADNYDRYTLAWERTFGEGHFSLEGRITMAAPVDNRVILEKGLGGTQTEFGNMLLVAKQELFVSDTSVVSGGLGLSLPTGSDINISNQAGKPLLVLFNEAVHFKPFLAGIWVPDHHWFFQSFLEYDVAGSTNRAKVNVFGQGLQRVGRYHDSSHFLFDMQAGYWFGESHDDHGHDDHGGHGHDEHEEEMSWMPERWAPFVELHVDRGLDDATVLRGPSYRITDISANRKAANMVFGSIFDLGHGKNLSLAYVTGVGGNGNSGNDQLRVVLNWPFNPR